jgi:hypothetical protein
MKKWMAIATAALTLGLAQSASAGWNDSWGNGNGYNDYPTWTPMYWMEEMFDTFDSNDFGNNTPWGWNRNNRSYNNSNNGYYPQQGYGYPQAGYPQQGYYGGYPQQGYGYSPYTYAQQYAPQPQVPMYQQSPYGYAPYAYGQQQGQQAVPPAVPANR